MKKFVSVLLAVTLVLTCFAGCTSKNKVSSNENVKQESSKQQTTEPEKTQKEEVKPVLKRLGNFAKFDLKNDPSALVIKEITGYDFEYDMLPAENPIDKLNLILSSGQYYDMIQVPKDAYYKYALQGALTPLDDLLKEHGPNVIKAISQKFLDAIRVDGKTYGIPAPVVGGGTMIDVGMYMRKDWLESVGMDMPKTLDEYKNVLKAFKDKNPGKADQVIPLTSNNPLIAGFTGAFGVATSYVVKDGKIVNRVRLPEMKEYLAYMKDLFAEGLLDNEFPINKGANVQEKVASGKAGLVAYGVWDVPGLMGAIAKNLPNAKFENVDYPEGKDGKKGVYSALGYYNITIIPKVSKHAADVIKYMNIYYDDKNFLKLYDGNENEHYKIVDGKMQPIQPKFGDERGNSFWYLTGLPHNGYDYWAVRVRKDENLGKAFDGLQKYTKFAVNDITELSTPIESVLSSKDKLKELEIEYFTKFIAGTEPLDKYDEFVKKWEEAGGAQAEKDLNDWYAKSEYSKNK